jgi:hypothetical protein
MKTRVYQNWKLLDEIIWMTISWQSKEILWDSYYRNYVKIIAPKSPDFEDFVLKSPCLSLDNRF